MALTVDRRRFGRRRPHTDDAVARMRLRTGYELAVIDVSNGGALVQGSVRLLPGTRVDVHLIARGGRVLVRSRVMRACVSALRADGIEYRSALQFEQAVDTSGYSLPGRAGAEIGGGGTSYPRAHADSAAPE
jgi:hypothetical protein